MAMEERCGDPVAEEAVKSLFAVPGIHCVSVIAKIGEGLPRQPGIIAARVNMGAKRVAIRHDPAMTPPDLRATIAALGFEAEPLADAGLDVAAAESRRLTRALVVAGFAAMNIMLLSVSVWSGAAGARSEEHTLNSSH